VPVLITVAKNESMGVYGTSDTYNKLKNGLTTLLAKDDLHNMRMVYNMSLLYRNVWVYEEVEMMHMMITDKMWTCEVKSLASDIVKSGGQAFVGLFAHPPKYDPDGEHKNFKCISGATCHASDMFYVLPQGRGVGIHGKDMEGEIEFSTRYSEDFLSFVHGEAGPWVPYDDESRAMTYYETKGPTIVPNYRDDQCKWLDSSAGKALPEFMTGAAFWKWADVYIGKPLKEKFQEQSKTTEYHALYRQTHKPNMVLESLQKVGKQISEKAKKTTNTIAAVGGKLAESATKAALDHMLLG